jgi:Transglycosylase SLT domain.
VDRLRADFAYNVGAGMEILRDLAGRFPADWRAVLRAYNGGPGFANSSPQAQGQTAAYTGAVEARRSKHDSGCP